MTRIVNLTRNETALAEDLEIAASFGQRFRGLMGRSRLEPGSGLLLSPCNSIHTFWMRFAIDLLYIDRDGRVVGLVEALRPNRLGPTVRAARKVLELPSGTIERTGTKIGDILQLRTEH